MVAAPVPSGHINNVRFDAPVGISPAYRYIPITFVFYPYSVDITIGSAFIRDICESKIPVV